MTRSSSGASGLLAKKIDAGERSLLNGIDRGEWTAVGQLASARVRYAGIARATLRRPRKA
jgi:hypothetical protein